MESGDSIALPSVVREMLCGCVWRIVAEVNKEGTRAGKRKRQDGLGQKQRQRQRQTDTDFEARP